jgi:hypothetical protein
MVIQATPTTFLPGTPPPVVVQPRVEPGPEVVRRPVPVAGGRQQCPRCCDTLVKGFNEPECLKCGYVDYGYVDRTKSVRPTNLVSAGTRYVLRYVGDSNGLMETLAYVQAVRLRNRAVYEVCCPFCSTTMEQSSLSGKRRDIREERFKCVQGHRVSLTPGRNSSLGWK